MVVHGQRRGLPSGQRIFRLRFFLGYFVERFVVFVAGCSIFFFRSWIWSRSKAAFSNSRLLEAIIISSSSSWMTVCISRSAGASFRMAEDLPRP